MKIKTDGKYEYRLDQLRRLMQATDENTKSGAFDFSTEFTLEMLRNLNRVLDHPDMTADLADELSTHNVELDYRIETDLRVND